MSRAVREGAVMLLKVVPRHEVTRQLVVVGGIPGAGKSTALAYAKAALAGAQVLDSDRLRAWFAARLPGWVPYRAYRLPVHLLHRLRIVYALVAGWVGDASRPVLVHSTATRSAHRQILCQIARWCGWQTTLVLIDTDAEIARQSQYDRRRVLSQDNFDGHVARWRTLRADLHGAGPEVLPGWDRVRLTTRADAVVSLIDAVHPAGIGGEVTSGAPHRVEASGRSGGAG